MKKILIKITLVFLVLLISSCSSASTQITLPESQIEKINDSFQTAQDDSNIDLDNQTKYIPIILAQEDKIEDIKITGEIETNQKAVDFMPNNSPISIREYEIMEFEVSYETNLDELSDYPDYKQYTFNKEKFYIASEYKESKSALLFNLVYQPEDKVTCFVAAYVLNEKEITTNLANKLFSDFVCMPLSNLSK